MLLGDLLKGHKGSLFMQTKDALDSSMSVRQFQNMIRKEGISLFLYPANQSRNWDGTEWTAEWSNGDRDVVKIWATKSDGMSYCKSKATREAWKQFAKRRGVTIDSAARYTINFQGMTIGIENPEGSTREGEHEDGTKWKSTYFHPYGFITGTKGADDEEIDAFVGPNEDAEKVYIIHQQIEGNYDEDKVMLGFDTAEHARDAYLAHYDTQDLLGPISEMTVDEFKDKIYGRNER